MKTTPLLNVLLVQHMDVPRVPKVLMLDKCDKLDHCTLLPGDLLDANSVNNIKDELTSEIDVVNTKLSNHISDSHCHTTSTEKNYWNNKLDAAEFNTTIAALQSQIPLNPITSANLADALEALGLLDANHNPTGGDTGLHNYLEEGDFLGTINGIRFAQGEDITIPVGSDPSTWTDEIWEQIINYINEHYDGSIPGRSYKITGLNYNSNTKKLTITLENNSNNLEVTLTGTGTGGDDYSIRNMSYSNGVLTVNQNTAGTKTVNIPTGGSPTITNLLAAGVRIATINGTDILAPGDGSQPYQLRVASADELGGIKIGYERDDDDSSRNYAVQLDDNNRAYVYVPWINTPGDDPNPDDPDENKDKIITLTESEFNELDANGLLEPDTTYIVLDDETGVVKFICYVDKYGNKHITTMPVSNEDELKVQNITIDEWNSMSDSEKDMNTIYVVYSGTGSNKALVGLGISKVLTRVPVPANGTVVRLTQSEYDNLGSDLDQGTLYLIVANDVVTKMYLGSIEIPVGSENGEGVVKSIITTMFSEKIQWEGDQVKSLNWSIIDVDDPGQFYAATGFEDLVTNTIKEAGFISKTYNANNFAEMFAAEVDADNNIVKKASILASINESGESNVKISADKIDVTGVFNQYASSPDKKSATQLLSDGNQIVARASAIADGVMRATEVTTSPGMYEISAVTVDNNNSLTSNALFRIGTQAVGSEIYLKADKIYLDGNTTVAGKISANAAAIGSLQADKASVEELNATNARINNLGVNYATIESLNAANARINDLEAEQLTVDYLTGGSATFKGDVQAKSLSVLNGENLSIKFTTYKQDSGIDWDGYDGFSTSGLLIGDPVGLIYNNGTLKYFFDFAPVSNENFSATALTTYLITHADGANKINITSPITYYRVDEPGHPNKDKYVTSIASNASRANVSYDENRYVCRGTITLIATDNNGRCYQVPCQVWRKVKIENGTLVKNYEEGYITPYTSEDIITGYNSENIITGYNIDSYKPNSQLAISVNENNFYTDSTYQHKVNTGGTYSYTIYPITRGYMSSSNGGTTAGAMLSAPSQMGWYVNNIDLLAYENGVLLNAPEMPSVEEQP